VVLLISLLGILHSAAALPTRDGVLTADVPAYGSHDHPVASTDSTTERGPLWSSACSTAHYLVYRWSTDASPRPNGATLPTVLAYDHPGLPVAVQIARAWVANQGQARIADMELSSVSAMSDEALDTLNGINKATNTAANVASSTNKIYSSRALQRMANEPGPYHNFPGSFDETVFSQGTREVVPGYFRKAKPNLGNDSIQYRLPGYLNGRAGTYEIFTRPSTSSRTELIMHRFFKPDPR
jgi:hypothetical protein